MADDKNLKEAVENLKLAIEANEWLKNFTQAIEANESLKNLKESVDLIQKVRQRLYADLPKEYDLVLDRRETLTNQATNLLSLQV